LCLEKGDTGERGQFTISTGRGTAQEY
jgi:hypothetical protein